MFSKYTFEIWQGVIFLFPTILSGFFLPITGVSYPVRIVCGLVLISCYVFLWFKKWKQEKVDIIELQEKSEKFYRYFIDFYKSPGELNIFCSDLDWMKSDKHDKYKKYDMIKTICEKGDKCTVYLSDKNIDPAIKAQLETSNVRIYFTGKLETKHRFSLLEYENNASLIIRDKNILGDDDKIIFRRENNNENPCLINMSKDLLNFIKTVNSGESNEAA